MGTIAAGYSAKFDAAFAKCRLLRREQAWHFVEHGYARIPGAFSKDLAGTVREQAWRELRDKHGISEGDCAGWGVGGQGPKGVPGYVRTAGGGRRFPLRTVAPTAFQALVDVAGGTDRLPAGGENLAWGDGAIANLGSGERCGDGPTKRASKRDQIRQRAWHKDGWHFRHFLDSPEQGLLVVPIFSDIRPHSGGTRIATDSIAPVARLLADNPQGLHADGVQGAGYLIPGLIEQCSRFAELTGEAGDLAILHPYMLHRPCRNPSPRPRFIANAALVLAEPLRFARPPGETYSLVELAVLRALNVERLPFEITGAREAIVAAPFRDERQRTAERLRLESEMRAMAERGVVTPAWGPECGYASNRQSAHCDARQRQRALWRSRRGMLELDLLLTGFAERRYAQLEATEQRAYLELLRLDDWTIWDWLQAARCTGEVAAPPHLAGIARLIVAEAQANG